MITWESHFERVTNLRIQFDVAETAIDGWAQSQEALNRYSNEELEALREIFRQSAQSQGKEAESAWVFTDQQRVNEYLQHVRSVAPQRLSEVKMRLMQNEYILHVAVL